MDNFATLFDATLEAIADTNEEIFYILNGDETRISIMKPLSEVVTGGSAEKRLLQVVNRRCGKFFL